MQDTLGIDDAATYLRIGVKALKELFDNGQIPGVSMNQKHTVFLRSELDEWLRTKGREQAAQRQREKFTKKPVAREPKPIGPRRRLPDLSAAEASA